MTLDEYLKANHIQGREFAATLGVHPSKVTRLRRMQRSPSIPLALKIKVETGGQVMPEDFLPAVRGQPAVPGQDLAA